MHYFPMAAGKEERDCERVWTSDGNNSDKRRHIERAKESLPEKSTVRHTGRKEEVEKA